MEDQLIQSLFKIEFPKELYNVKFETRLGLILKC